MNKKIAFLACGCFNPPTILHIRMFEAARDYMQLVHGCEVVKGIISPVSNSFQKPELISSVHRVRMCKLSCLNSSWIQVNPWESLQDQWTYTVDVLRHFRTELENDGVKDVQLMLLCGGDFVDSFERLTNQGTPLWEPRDLIEIASDFGIVIMKRRGSDPKQTIRKLKFLDSHASSIYIFEDSVMPNDVSSTRVREAIVHGLSIKCCSTDSVIDYIEKHELYK